MRTLCLLPLLFPALLAAQAPVIDNFFGEVTVASPEGKPQPAVEHAILKSGDVLHTELGSQATLRLGDNTLRVNWDSNLVVDESTDHAFHAHLKQGAIAAEIHKLAEGEVWIIDTPAGVTKLRETGNYRVDTDSGVIWVRLIVEHGAGQIGIDGAYGLLHTGECGELTAAGNIDVRQTISREAYNAANWVWPVPGAHLHTLATHEANRQKAEDMVRQANNPDAPQGDRILAPTHDLIVPSPITTIPPSLGVPPVHRP